MPGARRASIGLVAALLVAGCASLRVVPVPGGSSAVDPDRQSATVERAGVRLEARPSAWRGSPWWLPDYLTPFHLLIVNGTALPLRYDYADLRLFDQAGFQYTALAPVDVERILRAAGGPDIVPARLHRVRHGPFWYPWWWRDPWGWDRAYPYGPVYDDVLLWALPVGALQAGARTEGFAYFPRLREGATRLTLEFHHRVGETSGLLSLPFAIERRGGRAAA